MGRIANKKRKHSRNHKRMQARKKKRDSDVSDLTGWKVEIDEEVQEEEAEEEDVDEDAEKKEEEAKDEAGGYQGKTEEMEVEEMVIEEMLIEVTEGAHREEMIVTASTNHGGNVSNDKNTFNNIIINTPVDLNCHGHDNCQVYSEHSEGRSNRESSKLDVSDLGNLNYGTNQHLLNNNFTRSTKVIEKNSRSNSLLSIESNDFKCSISRLSSEILEEPGNCNLSKLETSRTKSSDIIKHRGFSVFSKNEIMSSNISQDTYDIENLSCDDLHDSSDDDIYFEPFQAQNNQESDNINESAFDHFSTGQMRARLDASLNSEHSDDSFESLSQDRNEQPNNLSQEENFSTLDNDFQNNARNSDQSAPINSQNNISSTISGRRIVDIAYFLKELQNFGKLENHAIGCTRRLENVDLFDYQDIGLNVLCYFKCRECNLIGKVYTNPPKPENDFRINETAVLAVIGTGSTFTAFQSTLAVFDIPYISHKTYSKYREKFTSTIDATLAAEMKVNASKEAEIAKKNGDVTSDGIPFIRVILDGAYGKRSYPGGRYDSLGAVVGVIGQATQKLIDVEVLNQYCGVCTLYENRNLIPPKHPCYKNYSRNLSSGSMEAAGTKIIFNRSIKLNGLIYKIVISDDDSSSYKAILDANPYRDYGITVEKIKCTNHLFRRLGRNIRRASENTATKTSGVGPIREKIKASGMKMRKIISTQVDRLTKDIDLSKLSMSTDECEQLKQKTEELQTIIKLVPHHVFGNHEKCPSEWSCDHSKPNFIPKIEEYGLLAGVEKVMDNFSLNAGHLLYKCTNNPIEQYFALVSKYITGKRVNYFSRSGYHDRVNVSAIDQISGTPLTKIYSYSKNYVPENIIKLEREHTLQRLRNKKCREANKNKSKRPRRFQGANKDYGPNAAQPDLVDIDQALYQQRKEDHHEKLRKRQTDRVNLEMKTREEIIYGQSHPFETDMIPSFLFGKICRMGETSSCIPVVTNIVNPLVFPESTLQYMQNLRAKALEDLELEIENEISHCGIFMSNDERCFYLNAKPDGTIGDDSIVVVCSISEDEETSVDEALNSNRNLKNLFSKKFPEQINTTHPIYYNIQGQLHVCDKKFCHFAVYTPIGIKQAELIEKDDVFWNIHMKEKLERFYYEALIDEIVDSRIERSMQIREAQFTIEARKNEAQKIAAKLERKAQKQSQPQQKEQRQQKRLSRKQQQLQQEESKTFRNSSMHEYDEEFIESYREIVLGRSDYEYMVDILTNNNYLDDITISSFLLLLEDKGFSIQFPITILNPLNPSRSNNDLQIIGGHQSNQHWCCLYFDGQTVIIYDSMNLGDFSKMSDVEKNYIKTRYPKQVKQNRVIFKQVTHQPDGSTCGVYAAAYATTVALGGDPAAFNYSQNAAVMRQHMYYRVISARQLVQFPSSEQN